MGLDMYLKSRKKFTNKEQEEYNRLIKKAADIEAEINKMGNTKMSEILEQYLVEHNAYKAEEGKCIEALSFNLLSKAREETIKYLRSNEEFNNKNKEYNEVSNKANDMVTEVKIGYWRKHADLNGYMGEIYEERGGEDEFNCVDLFLTKEDCENILDMAKGILNGTRSISKATGFFWGESTKDDWETTVEVFQKALCEVNFDTHNVVYSCWY